MQVQQSINEEAQTVTKSPEKKKPPLLFKDVQQNIVNKIAP
jgi:hypothetical protein